MWKVLYDRVVAGGEYITALAPMADVTDRAFRRMVATYSRMGEPGGGPDVLWTEFVSCDGLCSRGQEQLLRDLQYGEFEHTNLVAQIFGSNPDKFTETAQLIVDIGYRAIDINMGCPDQTINKQGAGACLIRTPELAREVIRATRAGAPNIPISVKTRIGWSHDESETWIPALLDAGIDALTIHARTRKELSDYPPHWDIFEKIVKMAEPYKIPILANGAILTLEQGDDLCRQTGAHGVMIGKASFGNPWLFDRVRGGLSVSVLERLLAAREHTLLYADLVARTITPDDAVNYFQFGSATRSVSQSVRGKSLNLMKKNFRCYINGFPHAAELRERLMNAVTESDIVSILDVEISNFAS
jgi:nifR3 family TIM-barrel protein